MVDAIKIFIGCAYDGMDAESQAVLEWSLRKNTESPLDIVWMKQGNGEAFTGWNVSTWATPFSGFRWAVPELCNFEGKAIYMDSDMIVMSDIAELIQQDHKGKCLLAKGGGQWRICVSVWDCEAAKPYMPSIEKMKNNPRAHQGNIHAFKDKITPFEGEWNCLDREIGARPVTDSSIKIIHYTDMRGQPQLRYAIPRLAESGRKHWYKNGGVNLNKYPKINKLFDELLQEAIENGYKPENYL